MEKTAGFSRTHVVPVTEESMALVAGLLASEYGLAFPRERAAVLARTLRRRMQAAGTPDGPSYWRLVTGDPSERERLVDSVTNNLSQFFRNPSQLRVLTSWALPRTSAPVITVWSAGCATGEEPWTVAMLLRDALAEEVGFTILATDISGRSLEIAERAVYAARQVLRIPEPLRRRFLEPASGGYRVCADLRRRVTFARHSVTAPPPVAAAHVIFCRNVLTYLGEPARRTAAAMLARAAADGGHLFIGAAEALPGHARFRVVRTPWGRVHQLQGGCTSGAPHLP